MTTRTAACACGQLAAVCEGEPIRVSVCHCRECKRLTGSAFSWNMRWEAARVRISGQSRDFVRIGDEGTQVRNVFCPDCGVTVHYDLGDVPGQIAIRAGCFAEEDLPAPQVSVYDPFRRVPWLDIDAPGLERLG